jgi:hypothetical protein
VRALALAFALLAAASCGGSIDGPADGEGEALADLALRPDEVPEGLEPDDEASGPMASLRDVLPPETAAPHLPALAKEARRSFVAGYDAVYRSEDQQGPAEMTSSVIRFAEADQASTFLAYLREIQTSEVTVGSSRADVDLLETPALGEEGYGWHRSAPGGESSGCSWRRGDLVFTLTISGPLGGAPAERAVELAGRLDDRLG